MFYLLLYLYQEFSLWYWWLPPYYKQTLVNRKEVIDDETTYKPLASLSEHFKINADKSIELTYEGAGECENDPTSLTVNILYIHINIIVSYMLY